MNVTQMQIEMQMWGVIRHLKFISLILISGHWFALHCNPMKKYRCECDTNMIQIEIELQMHLKLINLWLITFHKFVLVAYYYY